ncbi:hypothetical protein TKK_0012454 [Trichogramma kaykai]
MLQLATEGEAQFPVAAQILKKKVYVDDAFAGADSLPEALAARRELVQLLGSAQLELGKWAANDPALLPMGEAPDDVVSVNLDEAQSALGVRWLPRGDSFTYVHHAQPEKTIYTKRIVLAEVSRLFDPLGWISPIIIVAKILLQDLWLNGLD